MNILKSYKKATLKKDAPAANGSRVPAGEYTLRHSDKFHTILWDTENGESHIVDTPVFIARKGRQISVR
jgi:hypothetical protein